MSWLRSPIYRTFLAVVLGAVGFYNPLSVLSTSMQKVVFYLCVAWGLYEAFSHGIRLKNVKYPRLGYTLLLSGIIISMFMGTFFHPQSFVTSVMTTMPYIMAYLCFFIFMKLDVKPRTVLMTLYVLCAVSTVVYFCNTASMPRMLFGQQLDGFDENRGIIRIPVVFLEFIPVLVFYAINRYLIDKKKKWLFIVGWLMLIIFLSVVRQVIALTAVLGLWFYFRNVSWVKKLAIMLVIGAITVYVLPMIPIYRAMIEVSEDQRDNTEEDIRVTAWRYYLYENQTNGVTPILGNGVPSRGNSPWGVQYEAEVKDNGCFAEDVGWAGFYWYFGLIATVGLLMMFISGLAIKRDISHQYITYGLIFFLVTSVTSAPILYYWQVVSLTLLFYLAFRKPDGDDTGVEQLPTAAEATPAPHRHYPQITRRI